MNSAQILRYKVLSLRVAFVLSLKIAQGWMSRVTEWLE